MIELSFTKLLLVAVIALVVLGPEKLPKAARMAGAMLRRLRLGWDSVRSEVERELELEEVRRAAKEAAGQAEALHKAAEDSVSAVSASAHELHAEVVQVPAKAAAPPVVAPDNSTVAGASRDKMLDAPGSPTVRVAPEPVNEGARDGDV